MQIMKWPSDLCDWDLNSVEIDWELNSAGNQVYYAQIFACAKISVSAVSSVFGMLWGGADEGQCKACTLKSCPNNFGVDKEG